MIMAIQFILLLQISLCKQFLYLKLNSEKIKNQVKKSELIYQFPNLQQKIEEDKSISMQELHEIFKMVIQNDQLSGDMEKEMIHQTKMFKFLTKIQDIQSKKLILSKLLKNSAFLFKIMTEQNCFHYYSNKKIFSQLIFDEQIKNKGNILQVLFSGIKWSDFVNQKCVLRKIFALLKHKDNGTIDQSSLLDPSTQLNRQLSLQDKVKLISVIQSQESLLDKIFM